jgi:hypothetical protein
MLQPSWEPCGTATIEEGRAQLACLPPSVKVAVLTQTKRWGRMIGGEGINVRTMRGSEHSRRCATRNAPSHVTDVTENKTFTTSVAMPTDNHRHVTVECSTLHRQLNVQGRSRNHCCRAKAVLHIMSVCLYSCHGYCHANCICPAPCYIVLRSRTVSYSITAETAGFSDKL